MLDVLSRLTAIKHYAKDIHYNARGDSFYAVHLLMDRIADDLDGFIDSINEIYYLGAGNLPPQSRDVLMVAEAYIPSVIDIQFLKNLISTTLDVLDSVNDENRAVNSLLDSISQDLKLKLGLLNRQTA